MPSTVRRSLGTRDFRGAELRNARVHMYPTTVAMNGDAANSTGRIAYAADTERFYFGVNGAWIGLSVGSLWGDQVDTIANLPPLVPDGEVRIVLNDGSGFGPSIFIFNGTLSTWSRCADVRILLHDGSVELTGLLTDADPVAHVPTADGHLTHKKFVDAQDAATLAAANAHSDAADAAHASDSNPHPQYTTDAEATVIADTEADAAVAQHLIDAPHTPGATIDSQADARIAIHDADAAAHGGVEAAFAAHEADTAPHAAAGFATVAGVTSSIDGAIGSHDASATAHPDIRAAIIAASTSGASGAGGGDRMVVVGGTTGGGHGSPVVRDQFVYDLFHLLTVPDKKPDGIIDFVSNIVALSSALVFAATDSSVTVDSGTGLFVNDFFNPGTALNNRFFRVTAVVGNKLFLYPTPVAETVGVTAFNRISGGARIVLGGQFNIQRAKAVQYGVEAVVADGGDGKAVITLDERFSYYYNRNLIPATGASVTLVGLTASADDGIYTIAKVDASKRAITLTTALTTDQAAAAGRMSLTTSALASNFPAVAASPIDFYVDTGDAAKYSQTPGHYRLGRQVSNDQFIVAIEEVGRTVHATTLIANFTETVHVPKKTYFLDSAAGGFTLTLHATPVEYDRVVLKDIGGMAGTYNIVVNGNGKNIDGSPTALIEFDRMSLTLVYLNGAWIIE